MVWRLAVQRLALLLVCGRSLLGPANAAFRRGRRWRHSAAAKPDRSSDRSIVLWHRQGTRLVDMQGLLLHAIVHSAGVQDRDGGIWLLATLFGQFTFLAKLFADSAYAGSIFHTALAKVLPNIETEIVKRSDRAKDSCRCPGVG
jgi:hypothetical protein